MVRNGLMSSIYGQEGGSPTHSGGRFDLCKILIVCKYMFNLNSANPHMILRRLH